MVYDKYTQYVRRHLHYSEITACIHNGPIPNFLQLYLRLFPILVRQLFDCITACQLLKKKLLCYSQDNRFLLTKTARHKKNLGFIGFIPTMKSSSHVCISKAVKVSSTSHVTYTRFALCYVFIRFYTSRFYHICQNLNSSSLDKMAAVSQAMFSDAFPWMKSFIFWLEFHWRLFLRDHLTITQYWFR